MIKNHALFLLHHLHRGIKKLTGKTTVDQSITLVSHQKYVVSFYVI
jgi:hypothetical protein